MNFFSVKRFTNHILRFKVDLLVSFVDDPASLIKRRMSIPLYPIEWNRNSEFEMYVLVTGFAH